MKIIGIVAVDKNWGIGKNGGLLFSNLKEDMRHFRETTLNHFVIAGINTVNSFPGRRVLKDRITICIDQDGNKRDDCIVVQSLEECLAVMKENDEGNTEFYVIGGGYCYKSFLPYYDEVIVTKVEADDPEATVFFPNLDKNKKFKVKSRSKKIKDGLYNIKYITYERVK